MPQSRDLRRRESSESPKGQSREPGADLPAKPVTILGRVGLAGRTVFYAILTGLAVRIALLNGPQHRQANAKGALSLVSQTELGKVAIGVVAVGFVAFGLGRLLGAFRDTAVSDARRGLTAAQGLFYLGLGYVPASFLSGNQKVGSQQQQQNVSAQILRLPAGHVLLIVLGTVVIAVCALQIRQGLSYDFEEGLDLDQAPGWIRHFAAAAGVIGIPARSLVFGSVGVFLIVAAVRSDPGRAYGTDEELLNIARYTWGLALLGAIAAGLAVFVVFSAIETRYRRVVSAR